MHVRRSQWPSHAKYGSLVCPAPPKAPPHEVETVAGWTLPSGGLRRSLLAELSWETSANSEMSAVLPAASPPAHQQSLSPQKLLNPAPQPRDNFQWLRDNFYWFSQYNNLALAEHIGIVTTQQIYTNKRYRNLKTIGSMTTKSKKLINQWWLHDYLYVLCIYTANCGAILIVE